MGSEDGCAGDTLSFPPPHPTPSRRKRGGMLLSQCVCATRKRRRLETHLSNDSFSPAATPPRPSMREFHSLGERRRRNGWNAFLPPLPRRQEGRGRRRKVIESLARVERERGSKYLQNRLKPSGLPTTHLDGGRQTLRRRRARETVQMW